MHANAPECEHTQWRELADQARVTNAVSTIGPAMLVILTIMQEASYLSLQRLAANYRSDWRSRRSPNGALWELYSEA
jgi:hypothetical protein